eukprot:scaffold5209_cov106-Isochrysis_galbana.AAC.5
MLIFGTLASRGSARCCDPIALSGSSTHGYVLRSRFTTPTTAAHGRASPPLLGSSASAAISGAMRTPPSRSGWANSSSSSGALSSPRGPLAFRPPTRPPPTLHSARGSTRTTTTSPSRARFMDCLPTMRSSVAVSPPAAAPRADWTSTEARLGL